MNNFIPYIELTLINDEVEFFFGKTIMLSEGFTDNVEEKRVTSSVICSPR